MIQIETDEYGRLRCPQCGAGLYATVTQLHRGMLAFYGTEDDDHAYSISEEGPCIVADTWDLHDIESDLDSIYCARCRFSVDGDELSQLELTRE